MARRIAQAEWTGDLNEGAGRVTIGGEELGLAYTPAWLGEGAGTNAEELLAAAHASSFAMALAAALARANRRAQVVRARAELHLDHRDGVWTITRSDLEAEVTLEAQDARTRDMFASELQAIADEAAAGSPISRALAGVEITVDVRLVGSGGAAGASPAPPRKIDPRDEATTLEGRRLRAFEGQMESRMRAGARRRHAAGLSSRTASGGAIGSS
jgi:osmotically inducible protein OsmC